MSSMSVVDNVQLVDVNKKTHPQAILIQNDKFNNENLNDSVLSDIDSNEIVKLQYKTRSNDGNAVYAELPPNQLIDFEVGPVMQNSSNFSFSEEAVNQPSIFQRVSEFFAPIYAFLKDLLPSFDSITNAAKSVEDFGVSAYQTGKDIVCDSVDAIGDMGKSAFDYTVDFGKSIFSAVVNFFSGDSSTLDLGEENTEKKFEGSIPSNLHRVSREIHQSLMSNEISKPYWKSLNKIIGDNQQVSTGKKFFNRFMSLRNTSRLDDSFIFEGEHSILQINGQQVSKYSPKTMLDDFKTAIPDLASRQLISSFSHQGIFSQPYIELFSEHPDLVKFKPKDSQFSYVVHEVEDGVFQFTATSQADLESSYETSDHKKYNAFGVQVSMTLSKDKSPEDVEYSYYLR
ncbi:hypothetical protein bbp_529 [Buchnera aphidicola str. Bp (Baizongia pistaciae)]|uniref:Uncharacterized protein bbp_529 n=1 Tax=Buchnera aphidicola subsp. Baizongia pistaciae (strain Bp) TaxID=224915 RepID=Y529_BUCBP|nr:hypothetical protein [Buchnera aphidicola]Q89A26.1 RecName: Full=Uncharacterized protein bbp_529; AltName: Full=yba3 [Buchnera aphidicola str. Bp (Baizongia pistaciae)]AAO27231.1 hypothetical protein bbp_529 [Buchnera aphidicola str. Bp (Baizongia pistaciae)]